MSSIPRLVWWLIILLIILAVAILWAEHVTLHVH